MNKTPKVDNPAAYQGAAEVCLYAFRAGMGVTKAIVQKALSTLQQQHRWQITRFLPTHHGLETGIFHSRWGAHGLQRPVDRKTD